MKTAEDWYSDGGLNNDEAEISHRRKIQADALNHARLICESNKENWGAAFNDISKEIERL